MLVTSPGLISTFFFTASKFQGNLGWTLVIKFKTIGSEIFKLFLLFWYLYIEKK